MKVFVKGDAEVNLTKAHFVAEGGEGKVFARGDVGYKVYHDPAKAIPLGKIQELAPISDPSVVVPRDPLFSGRRGKHVGHTFRFVRDTWALCQLFPRAFREREGLGHDDAIALMRRIQEAVTAVHRAGVLVVDLNEMNLLVSRDFSTPYFIDVDSYQTIHYPATAIMPSVRDPLVRGHDFTEMSDWFSFGIVAFQLLVGIHPFKGKHPKVRGLEDRMRAGISVFDASVSVPKVAYPLDVVPDVYEAWFRALFVDGRREPPPADLQATIVVQPMVRKITGTDNFEITELHEFDDPVRAVWLGGGRVVVHAGHRIFVDGRLTLTSDKVVAVGFTPKHGHPVCGVSSGGSLTLLDLVTGAPLDLRLSVRETATAGETMYVRGTDKVFEVTFTEAANKVMAGARPTANVLENATRLYDGVAVQSLLGEPHVSLFPRPGACYQKGLPELKGHKVVQAKHDGGVLMVLAAEAGTYHRFVFRFDDRYETYDVRKVEDTTPTDLNFVVLDSGICACLNEDEELEMFLNRKGSKAVKTIKDPMLGGDMRLLKQGGRVLFHRDNKLYGMRMK